MAVCGLVLLALPFRMPGVSAAGSPGAAVERFSSMSASSPLCNSTVVPSGTTVLGSLCIGSWPQYVLFDPANGLVYAASEGSQNVSIVSASALQKVGTIPVTNARGLALDPNDGRLFITDGLGSNVTVLSTSANAVMTTFDLAGYTDLVGAQYDPYTGLVFFLANNNADLVGVNPDTLAISQVIPVDSNPGGGNGYAVDPTTHLIYFPSLGSDSVQVINQSTGATVTYVSMAGAGSPYGPTSTFYDPQDGLIYAMLGGLLSSPGDLLYIFDTHTGNTIIRMTVGSFPNAYALDPVRDLLYVTCADSGTISVINVTTNELVDTIYLGAGTLPGGIAVDPATGNVFVGEDGTGLLVELPSASSSISTSPCQPTPAPLGTPILASLCIGDWPQALVYDSTNHLIYASIENSQNVSVVNPDGDQVVATIPALSYARGLALDPYNHRLFVSDGLGDDVAVINTTTNSYAGSFNLNDYTYLVGAQFDPTTRQLFFLANNNDTILSVNATTYALEQAIQVQVNTGGGSGPIAAVNPQTHVMYYAARGSMEVDLIGELNGTVFGYYPTGSSYGPVNTFYDPFNHLLYVADGGWLYLGPGNQLVVLNATTGAQVTGLTVGEFPSGFAYDPSRHLLYVSCAASGTISVINDETNQLVGTISLGSTTLPGPVLVDPSTGNLFVGEDGTGMLVELPPAEPSNSTTGYWTPVATSSGPSGRAGFGMVYDVAMGKVVVFGGCTSGSFFDQDCNATNETWTYSGGTWTQLHLPVSPSPRVLPSMAYDPSTEEVLVFGGVTGYPNETPLRDTWEFNGIGWSELFPSSSPPASGMNQAMAYDPPAGAVVLFASGWATGAQGAPSAYLNETWTFSDGQWTQVLNRTGPSPRGYESFDYDASAGSMVLFGGSQCGFSGGSSGCLSLGDTWTYANGSWVAETMSNGPPPRNLAAMAYDPQLSGSLLVGGQSGQAVFNDVWAYANRSWQFLESPLAPTPREGAQMVYDTADHVIVLFGGYLHVGRPSEGAELYYNDTWTFEQGAPPVGFAVVSMELSPGPTPVGSLTLIVGDVLSATYVGYVFSGLPQGCEPLDTSFLVCAPAAVGVFTVVLTVTDSLGATTSGSIELFVSVLPPGLSRAPSGVASLTLVVSGAAGVAVGVALVAVVVYGRERTRRRERREGEAIARELEYPTEPHRPMP